MARPSFKSIERRFKWLVSILSAFLGFRILIPSTHLPLRPVRIFGHSVQRNATISSRRLHPGTSGLDLDKRGSAVATRWVIYGTSSTSVAGPIGRGQFADAIGGELAYNPQG